MLRDLQLKWSNKATSIGCCSRDCHCDNFCWLVPFSLNPVIQVLYMTQTPRFLCFSISYTTATWGYGNIFFSAPSHMVPVPVLGTASTQYTPYIWVHSRQSQMHTYVHSTYAAHPQRTAHHLSVVSRIMHELNHQCSLKFFLPCSHTD